jgi:hypothetical protein
LFIVIAYGVTPTRIMLILQPRRNGIENVMRGLFTSVAKKLRFSVGGRGQVFAHNFDSRVLVTDAEIRKAKAEIAAAVAQEVGTDASWPFVCLNPKDDRFGICGTQLKEARNDRRSGPPYLTRNGRPTLYWYLSVVEDIRRLAGKVCC